MLDDLMLDPSLDTVNLYDVYGPQSDGTWTTPPAAQPTNSPANTAGYGSGMSDATFRLLSQGIGAAGQAFNLAQHINYRRWEATNGGLYAQGQTAGIRPRLPNGTVNPSYSLLVLMVIGGAILLARG